jgi:hypothetical protein
MSVALLPLIRYLGVADALRCIALRLMVLVVVVRGRHVRLQLQVQKVVLGTGADPTRQAAIAFGGVRLQVERHVRPAELLGQRRAFGRIADSVRIRSHVPRSWC